MNKTKRTLLISSIVMVIVLAVVLVSVTAAWFSIYANTSKGGITIGSNTINETVTIENAQNSSNAIYPAIATKGSASKGNVMPIGTDLLNSGEYISQTAQCAVFYFKINFLGAGDSGKNDNRKTIQVSATGAYLVDKDEALSDEEMKTAKNYLDKFNVQMELVSKSEQKTDENNTITTYTKIDSHNPSEFGGSSDTHGDFVYYNQPKKTESDKLWSNNLNMLIVPGTDYYVKATVYFNRVDEECEEILQYATQFGNKVQFTFKIDDKVSNLNLRENNNNTSGDTGESVEG